MRDFASACLVIHKKKRHLQKVNCLICNQQVVGSSPTAGSLSQRGLRKERKSLAFSELKKYS